MAPQSKKNGKRTSELCHLANCSKKLKAYCRSLGTEIKTKIMNSGTFYLHRVLSRKNHKNDKQEELLTACQIMVQAYIDSKRECTTPIASFSSSA